MRTPRRTSRSRACTTTSPGRWRHSSSGACSASSPAGGWRSTRTSAATSTIGDRDDLTYEEKLEAYRWLADEYFQVAEYEEFCAAVAAVDARACRRLRRRPRVRQPARRRRRARCSPRTSRSRWWRATAGSSVPGCATRRRPSPVYDGERVRNRLASVLVAAATVCAAAGATSLPFAPLSSLGHLRPAPFAGKPGPELVPIPARHGSPRRRPGRDPARRSTASAARSTRGSSPTSTST